MIVLRLGTERDVLVGVQTDSPESLAMLRALFDQWVDDSMLDELADIAPAFEVHLGAAPAGARGRRTLPHLRYGKEVLARSDSTEPVLQALAQVLGGIHDRRPDDGRAWVNLRIFTNGTDAVLADVPRPHLVADRELTAAGIVELVGWGVLTDGPDILVPAPLTDPSGSATRLRVAGAVLFRDGIGSNAELLEVLARRSVSPAWFERAAHLVERDLVRTVRTRSNARCEIRRFLDEILTVRP